MYICMISSMCSDAHACVWKRRGTKDGGREREVEGWDRGIGETLTIRGTTRGENVRCSSPSINQVRGFSLTLANPKRGVNSVGKKNRCLPRVEGTLSTEEVIK